MIYYLQSSSRGAHAQVVKVLNSALFLQISAHITLDEPSVLLTVLGGAAVVGGGGRIQNFYYCRWKAKK